MLLSTKNKIKKILEIRFWKFDGLPQEIEVELKSLIRAVGKETLIEAIQDLVPEYEAKEIEYRQYLKNSGAAGQAHMEVVMQLGYLNQGFDFVKEQHDYHYKVRKTEN